MTNAEAIEKFKKIKRGNIFLIHQRIEEKEVIEDYSLCDMAISALQKQIPQKPKSGFCSQCGEKFTDDDYWSADYCRNCGQAINWEE